MLVITFCTILGFFLLRVNFDVLFIFIFQCLYFFFLFFFCNDNIELNI